MTNQTTIGFVLHSRAYRESSLLVDVFSELHGRFTLVAKGIKSKSNQAQRATLQPFTRLRLDYAGKSDLKVLCQAESLTTPTRLSGRALACGYYINELMIRSLQEWQEIPGLFLSYQNAIEQLKNGELLADSLRNFEVALLSQLGIAPDWNVDITGNPIEPQSDYFFSPEQGFEKVIDEALYQLENKRFVGQAILDLGHGTFQTDSIKTSQQITQMLLRQVIGQKPLESRKLWI